MQNSKVNKILNVKDIKSRKLIYKGRLDNQINN